MNETIAIVVVATGPYKKFLPGSLASMQRWLFADHKRRFFVLTDQATPEVSTADEAGLQSCDMTMFRIPHLPWPYNALYTFHYINYIREDVADADVALYIDVDTAVVDEVDLSEVLPDEATYFCVQHPGFGPRRGPFETRRQSTAWVDRRKFDTTVYYQHCFTGGRVPEFLDMARLMAERIDTDMSHGFMAVWHDESYVNRFLVENKPQVHTLDPGFAYRGAQTIDYRPRIRHLPKSREEFPQHPGAPDGLTATAPVPERLSARAGSL